jgi:exopolysaccharide production protein ExoY
MTMHNMIESLPSYGMMHTATAGRDWQRLHAAAIDHQPLGRTLANLGLVPAERTSKRLLDVLGASALIVLLSPLLLAITVLAWCEGGKAFFGHRRIGADGEEFHCWKFRTMVANADQVLARLLASDPVARAEWDRDFKLKNDPRVTRIGKLLRTTSLDELPQLFNVLAGEMSLVGPRPIVAAEVKRYGAAFHDYVRCRPGITGVWQISGRNDIDYGERVRLDQGYARHWSLFGDCLVLLRTPRAVLQRSGAY